MEAKGPGHLAPRDAAEKGKVSKATLQYYSESTENPILLAARRMLGRAARRIREAVSGADGEVPAMVAAVSVGPGFDRGFDPVFSDSLGHAARNGRFGDGSVTFHRIRDGLYP